jgi:hypothetical protein
MSHAFGDEQGLTVRLAQTCGRLTCTAPDVHGAAAAVVVLSGRCGSGGSSWRQRLSSLLCSSRRWRAGVNPSASSWWVEGEFVGREAKCRAVRVGRRCHGKRIVVQCVRGGCQGLDHDA